MSVNRGKIRLVNELHAPARRNFIRRKTIMRGLNETWQADLIDMQKYAKINKGYKYILTIIDILSKFAWALPLKTKTGKEITQAFENVFKNGKIPKNIHTDDGGEFFNTHLKKLLDKFNINLYSTYSGMKAAIVERFNRTLKERIYKTFSLQGNYKWINILSKLVDQYNSMKHRTIGMPPKDVTAKKAKYLLTTVFKHQVTEPRHKFNIGDHVRISKYKHIFSKSYTPNWSTEIFRVMKIQNTDPVTYLLVDSRNSPILGAFYHFELQKVFNPNLFLIEKVLRRDKDRMLVKWLGFDSSHNSWINVRDVHD